MRDYIHVVDLAKGHVKAMLALQEGLPGANAINLGTGNGISVLELVNSFSDENKVKIACQIAPRRPGDVATCYAGTSKAKKY